MNSREMRNTYSWHRETSALLSVQTALFQVEHGLVKMGFSTRSLAQQYIQDHRLTVSRVTRQGKQTLIVCSSSSPK